MLVFAGPFVAGLYSSRENGAFQERLPKGWYTQRFGRFGTFTVTTSSKYTKAKMFMVGKETKVFLRFSTVAEKGSAETERR
jgi:catalase